MFTKQGIDAEMVPVTNPPLIQAALASGDVQFSGTHAQLPWSSRESSRSRSSPRERCMSPRTRRPRSSPRGARPSTSPGLVGKTILIDAPNTIAHIGLPSG